MREQLRRVRGRLRPLRAALAVLADGAAPPDARARHVQGKSYNVTGKLEHFNFIISKFNKLQTVICITSSKYEKNTHCDLQPL